ncbi:MFS transporter [Kordiimonas sp.]|uniref:MFS transporter n=1 Tax=Kordiimonas sp. TaxID=1970157 RepID=UPI003A8F2DBF
MNKILPYLKPWAIPLAYSLPYVGIACLVAPLAIVQGIYAKYYGIPLTTIAAVILIARAFDVITDPVIGYVADRYYQKYGSRKPFIMAGGVLTVVSGYFLYAPLEQANAAYFTISLILFYLAYTLFNIPHVTWGGELSTQGKASQCKSGKSGIKAVDKTGVYSLRVMSGYVGMILFYSIPQLPFFDSSDITPETLRVTAVVAGLLILGSLVICQAFTPRASPPPVLQANPLKANTNSPDQTDHLGSMANQNEFRQLLRVLAGNTPFLFFCTAIIFSGIAAGMWFGLIFIYVDTYLGMGEQFAQMFMMAFAVGAMSTPLWYWVVNHIGKKNVWIVGKLLMMACFAYTTLLQPGATQFYELVLLKALQTFSIVGVGIVTPVLLSDIAEYGTWKYRVNRSASYFAIYMFMEKSNVAIAVALGLAVAGWYGFDAAATRHSQDSVFGLTLAMTWVPLFFSVISLIFFLMMPLNDRRSQIVRRRLQCRAERAARMAEATPETTRAPSQDTASRGPASAITPGPRVRQEGG